jgi:signal transduction histidine kinase
VSRSRSADAAPPGTVQRTADPALAPQNRWVTWLLIVVLAIPAVLVLALTGLRVTDATRSAETYGQVERLAALGQQVTGLAQAMADERTATATFIADGRPAAGLPALHQQYAVTDAQAARIRQLVSQLGNGYPAQTRAGAAQVLASIAKLPGLRQQATQSQASALAVITGYSAATSALFPVNDGIADLSGNPTLMTGVRALGSLSRMTDHVSQQQAILDVALAQGNFGPGALTALTTAQGQQASDLAWFRSSAAPEEGSALAVTLASPLARQAQAVEQRATAAGNGVLSLGPQASQQWAAGMSYTVGWMGNAEQQLAAWITTDAQALQRTAMRSAITAGGEGLAALALVLLGTLFAARSVVRRQRRLEVAALEGAGARLRVSTSAGFLWRNHELLKRLLGLIDGVYLNEEDPQRLASLFEMDHLATRIWRNTDSALVLAGHETSRPAEPLELVSVLQAAASEIEEYDRVVLDVQQGVWVSGSAATDVVHLLAELLENATTFSSETTQVVVSGYAVRGGGSLITITDGGAGMSEEELTLLNWQLASPSPADMAVAGNMGMLAVALLAARHGITVTLSVPPNGGTTAEVYLPAALVSLDSRLGDWHRQAGETPQAGASEQAGAGTADLPIWAFRSASRPEPPPGPETDASEAVPLMLSAPPPAPVPGTPTGVTEPGPVGAEPGDGPPIFESVRSGYLHAFGPDPRRLSERQAGQSPAERPTRPPAFWGDSSGRATAGEPSAAAGHASPARPQGIPQPGQVSDAAADGETQRATAEQSAEIARSFQRGTRRLRGWAG